MIAKVMIMNKIETIEQFEQLLTREPRVFFLKHSLTCPISAHAYREMDQFLREHPREKGYFLAVQESRELSNYIARKFGIQHESPQAFLFNNQRPVWYDSHYQITADTLAKI
jgi:bacillithiol system protein YtxJ